MSFLYGYQVAMGRLDSEGVRVVDALAPRSCRLQGRDKTSWTLDNAKAVYEAVTTSRQRRW